MRLKNVSMAVTWRCSLLFCFASSVNAAINLALHRPAYQSSTNADYSADLAVDGNFNNIWGSGQSCAHNGDFTGGPNWLVVDLGREYYVQSVVLTGRGDAGVNRLDYFIVGVTKIFNETTHPPIRNTYPLCGQYPTTASATEKMYVNCTSKTLPGKFVIIQQPVNGPGAMTICELEVYGYENKAVVCPKNLNNTVSCDNHVTTSIVLAVLLGLFVLVSLTLAIDDIRLRFRNQFNSGSTPTSVTATRVDKNVKVSAEDSHTYDTAEQKYDDIADIKAREGDYESIVAEFREDNKYASLSNRRTIMAP